MSNQKLLPWIIPEQCEGCTECINACPSNCLDMIETSNSGVFIPWLDNIDACTGCGRCEKACLWGAINLTSHLDQARERFICRLV